MFLVALSLALGVRSPTLPVASVTGRRRLYGPLAASPHGLGALHPARRLVPQPRDGRAQVGSTAAMKPEQDRQHPQSRDWPPEHPLEKLPPPEVVGQVDNAVLETVRHLWWRAFDRVCGCFALMRLSIFDRIWGPEPLSEQARTRQLRLLTIVLTLGLMLGYEPANAEGFDGRWAGTYTCGANAFHPDFGPFTWSFPVAIQNGAISGAKRYLAGGDHKPATAVFDGSIDQGGAAKINVHLIDVVSTQRTGTRNLSDRQTPETRSLFWGQ